METKPVRLDEEVLRAIGQKAKAFESPNAVLRRMLKLNKKPKSKKETR